MKVKLWLVGGLVLSALLALALLRPTESADRLSQLPTKGAPALDATRERRVRTALLPESLPESEPVAGAAAAAEGPATVDLLLLREKIPNNLYWTLDEPTTDPTLLELRAAERRRWSELKAKITSNTATEEEIDRYYEHRRKVSEDYIQFSELVLQEFGDGLPDAEQGGHELNIRMHSDRLRQIPRERDEALARKRAQDEKREAWIRAGRPVPN